MPELERICVFLGSSAGSRMQYTVAAEKMGATLAKRGITLVYGGGRVGLMGTLADATLQAGGSVIGVIPQALADKEIAHRGLTELHIVASMHERKAKMAELADAFIALPGGLGTLEEFYEILTWAQLGFHRKACALLNVDGFYDGLLTFFDHAVAEQFVRIDHRELIIVGESPQRLINDLLEYEPPHVDKWLKREDL